MHLPDPKESRYPEKLRAWWDVQVKAELRFGLVILAVLLAAIVVLALYIRLVQQ